MVLSALGDTQTKVECLELGAEDYLAKPFSFDELLARVRARLRDAAKAQPTRLRVGRLTLDLVRRLADSGGRPVVLADRESRLLEELMRRPGETISKERLLATVWGYHFDPGSNVVDVYVRRLRTKLGTDAVLTVRGQGYRVDG
jgi:DNA-binding response OmpR family regulator